MKNGNGNDNQEMMHKDTQAQQMKMPQQVEYQNPYMQVQDVTQMNDLRKHSEELSQSTHQIFGIKHKDSAEMKAVKDCQKKISEMMNEDKFPESEAEFQEELAKIEEMYRNMIQASGKYIATHKNPRSASGKARLELVKKSHALAMHEMAEYRKHAEKMFQQLKGTGKVNLFGAALTDVRGADFDLDQRKTEQTGAGTSDVTVIHVGKEKFFFKEKEAVCTPLEEFQNDYKQEMQEADKAVYDKLNQLLQDKGIKNQMKDFILKLIHVQPFAETKTEKQWQDAIASFQESVMSFGVSLEGYKFDFEDANTREILKKVVMKLGKALTRQVVSGEAGIDVGENLSDRNILTSRAGLLLKVPQVLANSNAATIHKSGQNERAGIAMEQAKGESYLDLLNGEKKNKLDYTPEVVRQFACLRLLDAVCGQIDRHAGNLFVTTKEVNGRVLITGVQGIDNDMAFGTLSFMDLQEKQRELPTLKDPDGAFTIPVVDAEMYQMMKGMTKESLGYFFGDMLKGKYLKALWDRWKGIVDLIEEEEKKNPNLIVKKEDWNTEVAQRFVGNIDGYIRLNRKGNVTPDPE